MCFVATFIGVHVIIASAGNTEQTRNVNLRLKFSSDVYCLPSSLPSTSTLIVSEFKRSQDVQIARETNYGILSFLGLADCIQVGDVFPPYSYSALASTLLQLSDI